MDEDNSQKLLARWQAGDAGAADELFRSYADRLLALVRTRVSAKLSQRLDPEDVLQSVFRSFFIGARAGRFELERGGDLWQLLVTMALHKLIRQARRLTAQRRDVRRESAFSSDDSLALLKPQVLVREPSPDEAAALADLVESLMRLLGPEERRMLELRLLGYSLEDIAADTHLSRRTVCRGLDKVKRLLKDLHAAP